MNSPQEAAAEHMAGLTVDEQIRYLVTLIADFDFTLLQLRHRALHEMNDFAKEKRK